MPQYQVIAEVLADDAAALDRIQKGLSRSFKMDLSAQREKLRRGGICVCRVDSLPEARTQAEIVRGIGANYRILDAQGRVVGRGEGRRSSPIDARARVDATLLGTGNLSGGTGEPGGPSFNMISMEALDTEDLVMLDGSTVEGADTAVPLSMDQRVTPASFTAPAEDETLELDEPTPRPRPRPAPPQVPKLPGSISGSHPAVVEMEALPRGEMAPTVVEPSPEPALETAGAGVDSAAPSSAPTPATRLSRDPAVLPAQPWDARRTGRTSARHGRAQRVLFGGWFRQRPRLRIIVGFAVALGLGSVGPIIQSRAVMSSRIRPELQDLVTVRAYPALARLSNYRSAEEIEETISGIKTRYGITSFLIWVALSGIFVFLWFRFV